MKTKWSSYSRNLAWSAAFLGLTWACQKDDSSPALTLAQQKVQVQTAAQENTAMMSAAMDVIDETGSGLDNKGVTDGRVGETAHDGPEHGGAGCGPLVSGSFNVKQYADSAIFSGTLVLDYGDGTACSDSSNRRFGKVSDDYQFVVRYHSKTAPWSLYQNIHFENFKKDTVAISGQFQSFSVPNSTGIDIHEAVFTYADGSSSHLNANFNWVKTDEKHYSHSGTKQINGHLDGVTREGISFSSKISQTVVIDFSCSRNYPVTGVVDVQVANVSGQIDYGAGICDDAYTVTINGVVTTYYFKKHHHS